MAVRVLQVLVALVVSVGGSVAFARYVAPLIWARGEDDCPDCWHNARFPNLGCKHPEYHQEAI